MGKWQKVTDEVLAVFGGLRKEGHRLKDIAVYGELAGGTLAAGSVLKLRDKELGMPAAVVPWSPWADQGCRRQGRCGSGSSGAGDGAFPSR